MKQTLSIRKYLLIGSLIFGMLFGAGNLIFPVHLGQMAGAHWLAATGGFLFSGVLLPLMALLAISITRAKEIYDLARPNGHWYALLFLILVHATLGPLFATPRTATVPYTIGFASHIPANLNWVGLLIYSAIFFGLVYYFSSKETSITTIIGKVLNPLFLLMLLAIFLLAAISPMGKASTTTITAAYQHASWTNGFLQGYNTMDALATLAFGVTVITAIRSFKLKNDRQVAIATAKGGAVGIIGIALIYIGLIYLGATSLHHFTMAENGGITLAQIAHFYLGTFGDALLATLATVGCLTTAMGLVVAFAQDFHQRFPKVSYQRFLLFNCGLSFVVANLGLNQIIIWSTPVLMFLYPLAITLIILGIASPLFNNDRLVYRLTTGLTLIPAFFDMVNNLPAILRATAPAQWLINLASHFLPFFNLGFGWLTFGIAGFGLGLAGHFLLNRQASTAPTMQGERE